MKRFSVLDDDGYSVGIITAKSLADAELAASGRQVKQIKPDRQPTHAERFRAARAEAGPAPY